MSWLLCLTLENGVLLCILTQKVYVVSPVKEFKVLDKPDPWFTNYLIERINDKNNVLKEARRSTCILAWRCARILKNIVNLGIDDARNKYYKDLSEATFKDSKRFWATVKDILPGKGKSKAINMVNDIGEQIALDDTYSYINSFFCRDTQ